MMNRGGRPPYEPNELHRGQVKGMAMSGATEPTIAMVIGVSRPTLRKYYRQELNTAHLLASVDVAGNLYKIATGDSKQAVAAAKFWLACRAGWKANVGVTHSGAIGSYDLSKITDADLQLIGTILAPAAADVGDLGGTDQEED